MFRLALTSAVLVVLVACSGGKDTGGVACTDLAAASVTVDTVDQDGNPVVPQTVVWSVDGGQEQEAQCVGGVPDSCTSFVAGWEVAGHFVVRGVYDAEIPDDTCCRLHDEQQAEADVAMDADGCHVVGQHVTLTFDTTAQLCVDTACR